MATIRLKHGELAIVDDEDFEMLNQHKWRLTNKGYATRSYRAGNKIHGVLMHREVNQTPKGFDTDHINCNRLDNRRANLRTCNRSENIRNQVKPVGSSGFRGVYENRGKWRARIKIMGKSYHIGTFITPREAAIAYDNYVEQRFPGFSTLNFGRNN